jgi:hypothetical protein
VSGACTGVCRPGDYQCAGLQPQVCDSSGTWHDWLSPCADACLLGLCRSCNPGAVRCSSLGAETCDDNGYWEVSPPCDGGGCDSGVTCPADAGGPG